MKVGTRQRVLLIPWYARADFATLQKIDRGQRVPPSYDRWFEQANEALLVALEVGQAVRIVYIHVDDYLAWLSECDRLDSHRSRLRYVIRIARGVKLAGSTTHL